MNQETDAKDVTTRTILPPHFLCASILLQIALDRWCPLLKLWGSPGGYIGGAIILVGLALSVYCALQFRRHETTIIPFQESSALMTGGIYRVSRNPIYLSMMVLLVGFAIALGSLSPWILPPLFMGIIQNKFILREEEMLKETFGESYQAYCERVRRWI